MKKVIVANYRYYISGGPEVYMFKFMDKSEQIGFESIPFSVNYSKNESTPYSKYFISSRGGDSVYYNQIKKTPKTLIKTIQGAFYNKEAVRNINKLIDDEKPSVLYALQVINTLSPSIFKAAKKRGLTVIHRISDFNLVCPKSDLLLGEDVCNLCIKNGLKEGTKHRCYHNSKVASIIRVESMKYHRRHSLYRYVDYFVTPTEFTRQKLIEGGFPAEKIVKIPTFIDAASIKPSYTNNGYFLYSGRLAPEKGVKFLIESLKHLKEFNVKLKVTGLLEEDSTGIASIIEENNLSDYIDFVGFKKKDELQELIANSIAVVCPAIWYENMPNVVLEAYAFGKPVIASNIGCFSELIEDGKTGYLFEPKNAEQLSQKLKLLLTDSGLASRLGQHSRAIVEEKYSPQNHLNSLKQLFERSEHNEN